jgi:hypothetical protein
MNLKARVARCYKVTRATAFIDKDILTIKRINPILIKLEKTNQDIYILETFNILKSLDNVFDLGKLYLILCELVDFKFHSTLAYLMEQLETFESNKGCQFVKRLQDLAREE